MNQRAERRRKSRRNSVSSHFTEPENNRRRPEYDRRGRTTVAPMPDELVQRILQGDTSTRKFEESGTE